MAMNPMEMMKIAGMFKTFQAQHPKALPFFKYAAERGIQVDSVIEMKVTDPEGHEYVSNIKVTPEDLQMVATLKEMGAGYQG